MSKTTSDAADGASASQRIDAKIAALEDWRGDPGARASPEDSLIHAARQFSLRSLPS